MGWRGSGTPASLPPSGAAGGDLSGTYPNPTVAKIQAVAVSANAAASLAAIITVNAQTGTSYTLALADAGAILTLSNASPIALTVPTNASIALPVGASIVLVQIGAGQVTVAGAGGVTVNSANGLKLSAQYAAASLIQYAANTWVLAGSTSV